MKQKHGCCILTKPCFLQGSAVSASALASKKPTAVTGVWLSQMFAFECRVSGHGSAEVAINGRLLHFRGAVLISDTNTEAAPRQAAIVVAFDAWPKWRLRPRDSAEPKKKPSWTPTSRQATIVVAFNASPEWRLRPRDGAERNKGTPLLDTDTEASNDSYRF